ncbi:aminodeoxychorismate synthase component I [Halieaceae bacterium IMCC14734]|uniref:aminodeoxychorismate synthase n=1 Tax=Candidatus Litorirhabdus singularis TaxID=2518993 RepID=A0ABT3TFY5_9GAMM|nr:aminodeoxychorismate synthase component I [Candidatus Litorirhabdus singularis]MCX2981220.1 aminodeoxychorismate synthase component I [Candidatus Litorirhabdus singularis]
MTANTVFLQELPYQPDSCAVFERIRDLPGAVFLDSSFPHCQAGRYDIITADPVHTESIKLSTSNSYDAVVNSFEEQRQLHRELFGGISAPAEDLPFYGGVAGHLPYEAGKPLQHLPTSNAAAGQLGYYLWSVVQDHLRQRCTFAALPALPQRQREQLLRALRQPLISKPKPFQLQEDFSSNFSATSYRDAFRSIQRYILQGDCYQVNLAQRFSADYEGDAWSAYRLLRPLAAAPFAGFMQLSDGEQLLCLSPERFLSLHGHTVETRPIKGTRPRHADPGADALSANELRHSPKDRAENLMIVDLLRNDLGRSCVAGSIHVEKLFELESFPTVHHLVSTIKGELLPDRDAYTLLRDCFPGGSITGAPKRRSMEIIEELEPDQRRAYCGSLFYISPDGRMDSNIAIRTLQTQASKMLCWGGGGIVADSNWEREYQETFDKVGTFLSALEATQATE